LRGRTNHRFPQKKKKKKKKKKTKKNTKHTHTKKKKKKKKETTQPTQKTNETQKPTKHKRCTETSQLGLGDRALKGANTRTAKKRGRKVHKQRRQIGEPKVGRGRSAASGAS